VSGSAGVHEERGARGVERVRESKGPSVCAELVDLERSHTVDVAPTVTTHAGTRTRSLDQPDHDIDTFPGAYLYQHSAIGPLDHRHRVASSPRREGAGAIAGTVTP